MQHVLGADFSYMIQCNHNRRSFVNCCLDMYKNLGPETEVKVVDVHKLYCLICPNLSIAVVQEAALYVNPTKASPPHYSYGDLQISFFFQIVFYAWLKLVSPLFHDEESRKPLLLKADDAVNLIEATVKNNVQLNFQLPMQNVIEVLHGLVSAARGGDISFKSIIKALVMSPDIKLFLLSNRRSQ